MYVLGKSFIIKESRLVTCERRMLYALQDGLEAEYEDLLQPEVAQGMCMSANEDLAFST